MSTQDIEGFAELVRAGLADGIVEGHHEAGGGRGHEALFDDAPGLQVVRQRNGAEVMAERRARLGRDREHGGHARHDRDFDVAPMGRAVVDRFAHRCGHGEDAGITAGHDADVVSAGCHFQRCLGAGQFLAVVGGMAALVRPQVQPVDIREIAEEVGGCRNCRLRFRGHLIRVAGADADDG